MPPDWDVNVYSVLFQKNNYMAKSYTTTSIIHIVKTSFHPEDLDKTEISGDIWQYMMSWFEDVEGWGFYKVDT